MTGTIYLIHFERKYYKAQHYLGWTVNLENRIKQHGNGTGSRLMQVITNLGIHWEVVRTWEGDKKFERRLKNWKKSRQLCPKCIKESL